MSDDRSEEQEKRRAAHAALNEPTPRMIAWVKNSCLYRLNQRMMTEHALSEALRRKALSKFEGISAELARTIADAGIAFCHEHHFLDDRAFAEIKAASGNRAGHSKRRISRDLGQKGVDRSLIDAAVTDMDDRAAAIHYARKRGFGPFRKDELDERRKAKELSAFARNGFSFELAQKIIYSQLNDLDDL